jgi:hypothetical protein
MTAHFHDRIRLKKAYGWLSEPQLRSAAVKNPSRLTPYTIEFLV